MHEFVTITHPEVGTVRCTRAAYEANYRAKGFRLEGAKKKRSAKTADSDRPDPVATVASDDTPEE